MLGQSAKNGVGGGLEEQGPFPPAQFLKPDPIKLVPMSMTVGPVTIGGNIFWRIFGGVKLSMISNKAQIIAVPRMAP